MLSVLSGARKSLTSAVLVLSSLLLAACVSGAPSVTGPGLGENVTVALLVPGGSGQAGDDLLSKGLENAVRPAALGQPSMRGSSSARNPSMWSKDLVGTQREGISK